MVRYSGHGLNNEIKVPYSGYRFHRLKFVTQAKTSKWTIAGHLNREHSKVNYSDVSISQMFIVHTSPLVVTLLRVNEVVEHQIVAFIGSCYRLPYNTLTHIL